MARAGQKDIKFQLAASKDAPIGVPYVLFTKTESSANNYTEVPALIVRITRDTAAFVIPSGTIEVPAGGSSLPLKFSVTALPHTDVSLTTSFTDATLGFAAVPAIVSFLGFPSGDSFTVITATAGAKLADTTTVSVTVSGTNKASYDAPTSTFAVKVVASVIEVPKLTATVVAADITATTANVNVLVVSTGSYTLYYQYARASAGLTRSLDWVKTQLGNNDRFANMSDMNQEFLGSRPIDAPVAGTPVVINLEHLWASTNYTFNAWVVNRGNVNATLAEALTVSTKPNGGAVLKAWFSFTASTYTDADRNTVLCNLINELGVDRRMVRSINNDWCGFPGDFAGRFTYNSSTLLADNVTAVQNVPFYFTPNMQSSDDTAYATKIKTNLALLSWVGVIRNTGANAAASLLSIKAVAVTINMTAPVLLAVPTITASTENVQISGLALNNAGFIFAIVTSNSISPVAENFRAPAASGESRFIFYFDGVSTFPSTVTVPGLVSGTSYNVFVAATNDFPGPEAAMWSATISTTAKLTVVPPPAPPASAVSLTGSIVTLVAAILAMFALF
jgi:hypothetical protein